MFFAKAWTILRILIIFSIGVYLAILLMVTLFQSNLIYFPDFNIFATPKNAGLDYEQVFFVTNDNVKLSGWFIPCENQKGVVLFCHGNAGNISHRLESISIFHKLDFSVFIFDYRGYGQSNGRPTEKGTYYDADAAWNYLAINRNIPAEDIIIFGRSLGGAVAAQLANKNNPRSLIIESAFTSINDLGSGIYPFLPVRLLSRFNYNTLEYVKNVKCPVMIVHSPYDEIIPFMHGQALFESAKVPKTFLEISGAHNEGFIISGTQYINGLKDFLGGTYDMD